MKIALIGATGLVGQMMIQVLEELRFPVESFIPAASERSVGKQVNFGGKAYSVCSLQDAVDQSPDIALFSAGAGVSRQWAGAFADKGCFVIDNSSAWRMDRDIPLVVPEVNPETLSSKTRIIANPNCSTIQLVVALWPLHKTYTIKRLVISTYQSVTGTGAKAVAQLMNERAGIETERIYPHPIDLNCFPHGGDFLDNGYTTEEMKLVAETRKIMGAPDIGITATVVRIPVLGGHSESVNVAFENEYKTEDVCSILSRSAGVTLLDDPENFSYPMPLYASGKNDVFVGRIRRDESIPNGLNLWIVSDNLRKGAATNAVQIAFLLKDKKLV